MHGVKINVVNQALILVLDPFDAFPIVCSSLFVHHCFKCFQEAFIPTSIPCVAMLCAIPSFPWECGGLFFCPGDFGKLKFGPCSITKRQNHAINHTGVYSL